MKNKGFQRIRLSFVFLLFSFSCEQEKQSEDLQDRVDQNRPFEIASYQKGFQERTRDPQAALDWVHIHQEKLEGYEWDYGYLLLMTDEASAYGMAGKFKKSGSVAKSGMLAIDALDPANIDPLVYTLYVRLQLTLQSIYAGIGKYDSSRYYARLAEASLDSLGPYFEDETKVLKYKAMSKANLTAIYFNQGDFASAKEALEDQLGLSKQLNDSLSAARALNNLAVVAQREDDLSTSITYSLEALRYDSQSPKTYLNLGINYARLGDKKVGIGYLKQAITQAEALGIKHIPSMAMTNIGLAYQEIKAYDSALFYLNKSYQNYEVSGDIHGMISLKSEIASLFTEQAKYAEAVKHLEQVKNLMDGRDVYTENLRYTLALAEAYLGLNQVKRAKALIPYLSEKVKWDDLASKSAAFKLLSLIYSKSGDLTLAYHYLDKYVAVKDSVFSDEIQREVAKAEFDYKLQREQDRFEYEKESQAFLHEAELNRQRKIALAKIIVLVIVAGFIYLFYRLKVKTSRQLDQKNRHLQELYNYKQGLTHMIAHDMKNPLNVVLGLSEGAPDSENLKDINQSGKLMLQMVTNMLDVQKYENMQMPLSQKIARLTELVAKANYQVELLLMARSIRFESQVGQDLMVYVDSEVITRVFVNLFSNAIKYTPIGGQLLVAAEVLDGRIRVSVGDTGKGIHPEELPYVFDRFWQTDAKKSGRTQSTGLGLTYCKMAVDAHGGTISVASKIGEGSTFAFDLPVGLESSEMHKPQDNEVSEVKNEKIAYAAEDWAEIQELIGRIKKIPLYKYTLIAEELERSSSSPIVEKWKEKVIAAAVIWNKEAYDSLLILESDLNRGLINS